jgi:hypothetical protein
MTVTSAFPQARCNALFILPAVFALVQARRRTRSPSVDPEDPESAYYLKPSNGDG